MVFDFRVSDSAGICDCNLLRAFAWCPHYFQFSDGRQALRRCFGFQKSDGDTRHAWLSTALSDWLSVELAVGSQLRSIPEENVAHMKVELALPEVDSLGKDSLGRIRQNLGSDLVVVGSYASVGNEPDANVRVDVRLQDTVTGETIATVSEVGTESRLFDLVSRTGERLREQLGVQALTPQEAAEVALMLPSNRAAAQFYSEGIGKLRASDALAARDLLQKVITIAPNEALPHSALATAWAKLGYDSAAVAEAKKATELSAGLPDVQRSLVQARYAEVSRNWDKAIETYRSLFQSFPDNIDYGLALANAQVVGAKWNDALSTLGVLRNLPARLNADPRIDWQEGRALRSLGEMKRAEAAFASAVRKSEASSATLLMARALIDDAMAFEDLGNFDEVDALVQRSKQLYVAVHDLQGAAVATTNQGSILETQGDSSGALKNYKQSLAVYESIGDKAGIAGEHVNIANVLLNEGELSGARIHNERARKVYEEIDEPDGVALAESGLGRVFLASGTLAEAKHAFDDSRQICLRTGNRTRQAEALSGLSRVMRIQDDAKGALDLAEEAKNIFASTGEQLDEANLQLQVAQLLLEQGDAAGAFALTSQAMNVFEKAKSIGSQGAGSLVLSGSLLKQNKISEAIERVNSALAIARKSNNRQLEIAAVTLAAQLSAVSGSQTDHAEAMTKLQQVIMDAKKAGLVSEEFDARLALAEIELASGEMGSARAELIRLEKDATQRGWQLVSRQAASHLKQTG